MLPSLTSCSCLGAWQNWKEQRKKKGEFLTEENKYKDMETDLSANTGLGFDGAAGSQAAVSMPSNQSCKLSVLQQVLVKKQEQKHL